MKQTCNCFVYYLKLRKLHKEAIPYYNCDHIITKIGDIFYDESGTVKDAGYSPFFEMFSKKRALRIIKQFFKDQEENYNV